jgi:hypothetical protein
MRRGKVNRKVEMVENYESRVWRRNGKGKEYRKGIRNKENKRKRMWKGEQEGKESDNRIIGRGTP